MSIIALAWPWNTWKSTIINWDHERDWAISLIRNEWKQIKHYWETARELLYLLPNEQNGIQDLSLFQEAIRAKELHRLSSLIEDKKKDLSVIVDRTYIDNTVYWQYNALLWRSNYIDYAQDIVDVVDLYDFVVLLTTPMKNTSNALFNPYNDEWFVNHFNNIIRKKFWNKVVEFTNSKKEYEKIVQFIVDNV